MNRSEAQAFLEGLGGGSGQYVPPPSTPPPAPSRPESPIPTALPPEIVRAGNGELRQAGASDLDGRFIRLLRTRAEQDLYFFARVILRLDRLVTHLHKHACDFATRFPPYRKLILIPRDCFKTTLFSKALPLHMFIQPAATNVYWPGHIGLEHKILLACEKQEHGEKHIQWIQSHIERNELLRSLWPHIVWENPGRDAKRWNTKQFFLPRELRYEQSDPTMQTIGVGGAITGSHVTDIIDDDLVTFAAANSPTIMQTAIDWHTVSRALLEDLSTSREFIIGTRWAVSDLYGHIIDNDPTVAVYRRSLIENGKCIFPEEFTQEEIDNLQKSMGSMFPLLYQNDPTDARLVDFDEADIREYNEVGGVIHFDSDPADLKRFELLSGIPSRPDTPSGPDRFREVEDWAALREEIGARDGWIGASRH